MKYLKEIVEFSVLENDELAIEIKEKFEAFKNWAKSRTENL